MNPHAPECYKIDERSCSCGYDQVEYLKARAREAGEAKAQIEIAAWVQGLAGHSACPPERRDWYLGVASDILHGGPWKADAEYRRKNDRV